MRLHLINWGWYNVLFVHFKIREQYYQASYMLWEQFCDIILMKYLVSFSITILLFLSTSSSTETLESPSYSLTVYENTTQRILLKYMLSSVPEQALHSQLRSVLNYLENLVQWMFIAIYLAASKLSFFYSFYCLHYNIRCIGKIRRSNTCKKISQRFLKVYEKNCLLG